MSNAELTFEVALKQLNDVVQKLEKGECPLDDAITEYQKAVDLIKFCNSKLTGVEQQVKLVSEDGEGGFTLKPFSDN